MMKLENFSIIVILTVNFVVIIITKIKNVCYLFFIFILFICKEMSDDEDDGWELLVGPAHYQTNSEKNLHEFCNAAKNGDLEKVLHFSFCKYYYGYQF